MNARAPLPPPPHPGAMPGFQQQQQQPAQRQFVPPPFHSNTRYSDITPPVTLTEQFCRRQLTSYEVQTVRKVDPIIIQDLQDKRKDEDSRKQKKRAKSPTGPKQNWLRVAISVENYEQDTILKKIKVLDKKRSITDKKAALPPHMNSHANTIIDEKNHFEFDTAFIWSLCQLDRVTITNKKTKKKETETLILYLKRSPRPDVNVITVYRNIERLKLQPPQQQQQQQSQNQQGQHQNGQFPPQQRPQPQGPQQRAPSQGPQQRAPGQGPPRQQPNNQPGRSAPAPVQVIHDGGKNGGRFGPKGGDDEIIHVIETSGPNRKAGGKSVYTKGKSVRYRSDDSSSSRSSRSGSDSGSSDSGSAYSDTESEPSSISLGSLNQRRRRDSGFARGKGKGTRQHEREYVMVNKPRRHSSTAYVPDAPRTRSFSYERLSHDPVEVEARISEAKAEAFVEGFRTAARSSAVGRASTSPQRTIAYQDDLSQHSSLRSHDEEFRVLDDTRAEVIRLENIRLQEELRLRDLRQRDEANARRFSDDPIREELRLRTDMRRAQDAIRRDELSSPRLRDPEHFRRGSLPLFSYDSSPSPRARDFDHMRRDPLSPLPLETDMPFAYVRNPNPFAQRRREPSYID